MRSTPKKPAPSLVVVTGGNGFIGTHLCRHLLDLKFAVRVVDLVGPKAKQPGIEYRRCDLLDRKAMRDALGGASAVIHLAAIASVPRCEHDPLGSNRTNLVGTAQLLEATRAEMRRAGSPIHFLFASSCAVYGGRPGALHPDDPLGNLHSLYAIQKASAEMYIRHYQKSFHLPATILRLFNVYGPGQARDSAYSGVITTFCDSLLAGRALELHGGGEQTRDFVSVHDVSHAFACALKLAPGQCLADPLNVGTGRSISIRSLAEALLRISRRQVPLSIAPSREGDVGHALADVSRTRDRLAWEASRDFEKGLAEVLESLAGSDASSKEEAA